MKKKFEIRGGRWFAPRICSRCKRRTPVGFKVDGKFVCFDCGQGDLLVAIAAEEQEEAYDPSDEENPQS
jgi:hypothetical protein